MEDGLNGQLTTLHQTYLVIINFILCIDVLCVLGAK